MLIPIIGTIGFFTMVIFSRKYENDERMAMIAKGIDPFDFSKRVSKEIDPKRYLGIAFVLIGFGIGLLMGSLLESLTNINGDLAHFSMIFIFGGLGLLASYFYQMNLDKKNSDNKESKNNFWEVFSCLNFPKVKITFGKFYYNILQIKYLNTYTYEYKPTKITINISLTSINVSLTYLRRLSAL
jgi:hypothetical protein